jgi:hypothetical protein
VKSTVEESHATATEVAYSVAIPVAIFLVLLWLLHVPIVDRPVVQPAAIGVATVGILLLPLAAGSFGVAVALAGIALVVAALLAQTLARSHSLDA